MIFLSDLTRPNSLRPRRGGRLGLPGAVPFCLARNVHASTSKFQTHMIVCTPLLHMLTCAYAPYDAEGPEDPDHARGLAADGGGDDGHGDDDGVEQGPGIGRKLGLQRGVAHGGSSAPHEDERLFRDKCREHE